MKINTNLFLSMYLRFKDFAENGHHQLILSGLNFKLCMLQSLYRKAIVCLLQINEPEDQWSCKRSPEIWDMPPQLILP